MAVIRKKSVASYYTVAAVWLIWAFCGPLYRSRDYIFAVLVSVLVWFITKTIFPDRSYTIPDVDTSQFNTPPPKQEPAQKTPPTGNPDLDSLIQERDRAVNEMHRLNNSIKDPLISSQINHLVDTTHKIIDYVVAQPSKLPQIRKLMNYYLPTTIKLLNAYDRMDSTGVSGTNIDGTKGKIEDMMKTICTAFDRQLDALFGDEALDIASDITVMEQMLAQEGLAGNSGSFRLEL